ncbi:DUF3265 domain-containing protein, partial [Vibrio vulnificus]|nr:DUF3265 domain-containing protein [Vibrio vulnificus]MBY7724560.1 DUF3265 domain-containing protein [Vibrio vulnificus]
TRRSRGIHAAWHFWYAVSFCGESGLRKVCLCGIHPLTRRYVYFPPNSPLRIKPTKPTTTVVDVNRPRITSFGISFPRES